MKSWNAWLASLEVNGSLAPGGNHFLPLGAVLRPGNRVDQGPYLANHESVAGYILVLAPDLEEAITLARDCPILAGKGTSVEVRETGSPGS